MAVERDLVLLAPWRTAADKLWLGLDLVSDRRVEEIPFRAEFALGRSEAIVVPAGAVSCRDLPDGNLLLGEGILWSLLDPLRAGRGTRIRLADRQVLEAELHGARRRFRERLRWWAGLEETALGRIRALGKGQRPDLTPLFDLLDAAAAIEASRKAPSTPPSSVDTAATGADVVIIEPEQIATWLQDEEGFGRLYGSNFTPRVEQADMAREVSAALGQKRALLIEAGTGVGKTLAYLVPLLTTLAASGGRAVVSTHTRALQTQILEHDLPRLRPLLGDRKYALLMGRSNYLCRRQRETFLARQPVDLPEALQTMAFELWLRETSQGLREELADHPLLKSQLSTLFDSADLCLPQVCYSGDKCFVQRARRRAREADLLVVNHALLMADLLAEQTLLGEVDHLVVDEAHRLPPVTLDAHTVVCSPRRIIEVEDLLGKLRTADRLPERIALVARRLTDHGPEGEKAAGAAADFGRAVTAAVGVHRRWWRALGERVDQELTSVDRATGQIRVRDKDEAFGFLRPLTAELLEALATSGQAFATLAGRAAVLDDLSSGLEDDLALIAQSNQLLRMLHRDIRFLTSDPDDDWVTWLQPRSGKGLRRLGATPLEAGSRLRNFWQEANLAPVMTSATLAIGEDFTHMLGELGLTRRQPSTATYLSASPFDFHRQTLALVPGHFPAPGAWDFGAGVGEVLRELALKIPRKTLGLFTSYQAIGQAAEVMEQAGLVCDDLTGDPSEEDARDIRVLVQTPRGAAGALLEQFRLSPRAVLLGTNTFWEGVDFPGEDLEILVVTKLPFLVPNDPWVEARCEKIAAGGENPFTTFMVRDAVLRLRQGIGRLIRRTSDRGVFIVLDNRLHTKNYGVTFLNALPVMPVAFEGLGDLLERVTSFFSSSGDSAP